MSAGMPELGSKISLISKADIRYEGRLFTVDPQECTIALANVRSFGTEDRETSYPILPQSTVYDYILFRGSDIKDIRVVNNVTIPNDPAIMQMHLPPQQNFMPQNFGQQQPGTAQVINQFGIPFNQMQGGNMVPSMGGLQQQQAQSPIQNQGNSNSNLASGSGSGHKNKKSNSRSGTPQNLSRKSPTSEMGSQTNQNRENQSGANKDKPQRNNQRNNDQQRERRDDGRNDGLENKGRYRIQNSNQRPEQRSNQTNNHQNPQQQQQQPRGYNNNRTQNQNQIRGNQMPGGTTRMRGNPPMHQNNFRQQNNQGAPTQSQNKPNGRQEIRGGKPLKFENEFDFEQANSKFEELRLKLQRLKVGSEETKSNDQVNGEIEKKDDSGNETGADHEAEVDENAGYDKNKSFFDNISCEAVERSKGKTQRTDWRTERKLNSETFGYAFNRRGNYRGGRGGYYPRQFNGQRNNFRGGNPNYRPMRNHRNQNNVDGRSNAPVQVIGQQSQSQSAPVTAN